MVSKHAEPHKAILSLQSSYRRGPRVLLLLQDLLPPDCQLLIHLLLLFYLLLEDQLPYDPSKASLLVRFWKGQLWYFLQRYLPIKHVSLNVLIVCVALGNLLGQYYTHIDHTDISLLYALIVCVATNY